MVLKTREACPAVSPGSIAPQCPGASVYAAQDCQGCTLAAARRYTEVPGGKTVDVAARETVHVQIGPGMGKVAWLAHPVAEVLRLKDGQNYQWRCGRRATTARLRFQALGGRSLQLSLDLERALLVPPGVRVNIGSDPGDQAIRLGPAIGVLVRPPYLEDLCRGMPPWEARELARANAEGGLDCLLFFFTVAGGIDYLDRKVEGCHLHSAIWSSRSFPFPDVVYDRGVSFPDLYRAGLAEFRREVQAAGVKRVNAVDALEKWGTHLALGKFPTLTPHLPETHRLQAFDQVLDMLDRHSRVILKGRFSNRGEAVMLVVRTASGARVTSGEGVEDISSTEELRQRVLAFTEKRRYIAQQAVPLLQARGRAVDWRVLLAKDGRGEWGVAQDYLWMAQPGVEITTTALGAEPADTIETLCQAGMDQAKADRLRRAVCRLGTRIASCLEQEFGPLGELALDLGVDRKGHLWFFEANSKPIKRPLPAPGDSSPPLPEFLRPLQYCMYLAGFPDRRGSRPAEHFAPGSAGP